MKKTIRIAALAAMALAVSVASAQSIKIATGSPKGTYSALLKELNAVCATEIPMVESNTSGSMQNLDLLTGNQINAAFIQTDVLYFRSKTEELGNIKTLLAFHPEEVHVVALSTSKTKEGGFSGIGAKPIVINSVGDLAGRKVGAAGGSFITGQFIRLQSEIPYNLIQFENNDVLMKALAEGQVDAAILVGGSPLGAVAALTPEYKLLSFPEAVQGKLKGVYRPARVSYSKMNAQGVQTIATDALLVTREYKTEKMNSVLSKFRTCAVSKIPDLQETTGNHPKWQAVDTNNKGKWAWYDFAAVKK